MTKVWPLTVSAAEHLRARRGSTESHIDRAGSGAGAIDANQAIGRAARLRRLDTLLLESESSAPDLGSKFLVITDQI